MTLLNELMGDYHFNEVCSITVRAAPSKVYQTIKEVTASDIPLLRGLFSIPFLPRRVVDNKAGGLFISSRPLFEQALNSGFILLAESPNQEFVLGWAGQFWKLRGGSHAKLRNRDEFAAFDTAGYAKAAIAFRIERGEDHSSKLSTETRIRTTDEEARRKFASYWRLIHLASALLRCMWLYTVKGIAEDND